MEMIQELKRKIKRIQTVSPWMNLTKTYNKNTSATSETLIAVPVEKLEL